MSDALRPVWDFDDLDATERRFQELLDRQPDAAGKAEVLTQLARVHGLRGDFEQGERTIQEAEALAAADARARARIDLERGRLLRSGGDPRAALPLFEAAFATARQAGELFIAADAAHMSAIAAPDRKGMHEWAERGIEIAQSGDGSAQYWVGPLLNNLGWEQYEAGEYETALETFERALEARERDPRNEAAIAFARYGVAKALMELGRYPDAAAQLEVAVAWTEREGKPDGWLHEALAESYAALRRAPEAREHALLALPLLGDADPTFEADEKRAARLRELSQTSP